MQRSLAVSHVYPIIFAMPCVHAKCPQATDIPTLLRAYFLAFVRCSLAGLQSRITVLTVPSALSLTAFCSELAGLVAASYTSASLEFLLDLTPSSGAHTCSYPSFASSPYSLPSVN